jgi:hypothetical protein
MDRYLKIILTPCLLVVLLSILVRVFVENNIVTYLALAIEWFLAITIGYRVILSDRRETLMRCAILAAMIGVTNFLVVLPAILLFQWDTGRDYAMGIAGYFLASAIGIGLDSLFGLLGGKLGRNKEKSM